MEGMVAVTRTHRSNPGPFPARSLAARTAALVVVAAAVLLGHLDPGRPQRRAPRRGGQRHRLPAVGDGAGQHRWRPAPGWGGTPFDQLVRRGPGLRPHLAGGPEPRCPQRGVLRRGPQRARFRVDGPRLRGRGPGHGRCRARPPGRGAGPSPDRPSWRAGLVGAGTGSCPGGPSWEAGGRHGQVDSQAPPDRASHPQGVPGLPAGPDHRQGAAHGPGPGRVPLLRLRPHRHAGPRVRRDPARQGRRRVRQAALPLQRRRRPRRGPALRPDRAVRPLRRPAHRRAGHAVQALSHGAGLARRERRSAAATASSCSATSTPSARLPTPPTSRWRSSSTTCCTALGFERLHDPRQQPHGAERPAGRNSAWPTRRVPCCARSTSWPRSAATKWSPR